MFMSVKNLAKFTLYIISEQVGEFVDALFAQLAPFLVGGEGGFVQQELPEPLGQGAQFITIL